MTGPVLFVMILITGAGQPATPNSTARAQANNAASARKAAAQPAGSLSGRVVSDSGQPMADAIVYINGAGKPPIRRNTSTDDEGKFRFDDLPRGVYQAVAQVRGYISERDSREPAYYKLGDSVNLIVTKGGVITGTVTNSGGEPVIGIRVVPILQRRLDGSRSGWQGFGAPRYTDDRGVYRLFALTPGVYFVAAAGKSPGSPMATPFDEDIQTYYPSSTRDTAAEIVVRNGVEATGIDIRYRGERGFAISGSIAGDGPAGSKQFGIAVSLIRATGDAIESQTSSQVRGSAQVFAFYGVTEGEYYLTAQRYPYQNDDGARARPVRVKVKDQNITGLELSVIPLGSVSGRVILDAAIGNNKPTKCESKRLPAVEETLLYIRRDRKEDSVEQFLSGPNGGMMGGAGDNGEFLLPGLEAGQYRIDTRVLDEAWYVRAVSVPPVGRATTAIDAGRRGILIKSGERVKGLIVSLAEGAASFSGRVVAETKGAPLPDRLRVHLVPTEPETADETLRFAEAVVQGDGAFALTNLAPGRYWVVARQASEEDASERNPRPLAWNPSSHGALLREAEALNIVVELKPCRRVVDYELRYAMPKTSPKEPPKAKRP